MVPYIPDVIEFIYCGVGLLCLRSFTGHLAWAAMHHENEIYVSSRRHVKKPKLADWSLGALGGIIAAAIWPVFAINKVLSRIDFLIIGDEREGRKLDEKPGFFQRRHLKEAQNKEMAKRELRIREKELGLEPWEVE